MPRNMQERVTRWAGMHPGWRIRPWSGTDCDLGKSTYATNAYRRKQWAYCSDYVRLLALHEQGGVYLDTDVELLRPFDLLADGVLHLGYMHNCALGTAVIISPPRHPLIGRLLAFYEQLDGEKMINNNAVFTEYFLQEVPGFKLNGRSWSGRNLSVHPKTTFEQPDLFHRGYAVHLYDRSWGGGGVLGRSLHRVKPSMFFGLKRALRSWLEESRCFYLHYYLRDRYRLPVRVPRLAQSFGTLRGSEA